MMTLGIRLRAGCGPNLDHRSVVTLQVDFALRVNVPADAVGVDTLDTLFRVHYARLVRALTLVSGSREAAADAVQEAFVKAHLHWDRIRRYDDPVGWIRRIAINRLRDDHRHLVRKQRIVDRLAAEPPTVTSLQTSHDADLQWMLAQLPRQQRLALALFYVDELTVAEVATAMRLSEGAVKFHLHQGRERLRDVLSRRRSLSHP
jgi:RNA polymerase sigma-70 factor (ECF subfamily)